MSRHQHDADAQELWQHYCEVLDWVERIFPNYRAQMKGLDWGRLFRDYGHIKQNAKALEERIVELIDDDEVSNKKGIYEYLLSGHEKTLNLRAFDTKTKQKIYEKQKGICPLCNKHFEFSAMQADHIVPWSRGGKTVPDNCQMLCERDNKTKSAS